MIAQQARAVAAGAAVLLVVAALWFGLAGSGQWPEVAKGGSDLEPLPGEALEVLEAPRDVDDALAVAEAFASALYRDDVDAMRELVTDDLEARLLVPGQGGTAGEASGVEIDGATTQDVQPGRVLAKVAVRRDGRLEVVTVVVVLVEGRWLVDDAAF